MIEIKRFVPETAYTSHEGTILADKLVPPTLKTPFEHQYGYLEPGKMMGGHAHDTDEIYIVYKGNGFVHIGKEKAKVTAGDVVVVPPGIFHTMEAAQDSSLLWAALWWQHIE